MSTFLITEIPPIVLRVSGTKFAVPIYLIARHEKDRPILQKKRTLSDILRGRPDEPFGDGQPMIEERHTRPLKHCLQIIEITIYYILALLLAVAALAAVGTAGQMLFASLIHWTIADEILPVLEELLLVLMIVEVFHTVSIAIRSHILLAAEPFLIVGVIASIRRVLVISLETSTLTNNGKWTSDGASMFRAAMIELGLLVALVLVLVVCIVLLRRYVPAAKNVEENIA
jgi:Phosphate-starvation-inducible E family